MAIPANTTNPAIIIRSLLFLDFFRMYASNA